ncbi:sensor histidine kinase [Paenibacillus sp. N3.4]|uniref:sensor histidine kinase n=1 Tax=Paenibacillus sp. N3.4 TaxID=2603222 RepID=UPI0011CC1906|nr:sensor histidine kinase [Paenibacillus sp. N3.4]TXK84151.1 sensor histidine kinase [Paenibacillus sp. N3.4]
MRSPIKRYRINALLAVSFAGVFIILLILVCVTSYFLSSRELASNTSFYQQRLLNELNKQVASELRSIEQISLTISKNNDLNNLLTLSVDDYYTRNKAQDDLTNFNLLKIVYSTPNIESIQLYMKRSVFTNPKAYVQITNLDQASKEDWYEAAMKSDFSWIGERDIQTFQGTMPVVTFARKLFSSSFEYQGMLLINVKVKVLQNMMQEDKSAATRFLLDTGGRPILSTSDMNRIPMNLEKLIPDIKDNSGYLRIQSDMSGTLGKGKEDNLVVWSRTFSEGWLLLEVTPWSQITAGSVKLAITVFTIGLTAIVFVLLFTFYLSRSFTKPIILLTRQMAKYPADDKRPKLPGDYSNEFGHLFNGYNRLIDRIEELYRSLEAEHKQQRKAEMKALQAMINPHFLYNTLDQLNWMAIEAGHQRMSHVLELMGKMFRVGLSNGESLISLEQELVHTVSYLQIQQIRWEEGLTYQINIPESAMPLFIPKLTLQPFVENAIMHGFHGRKRGHIEIEAVVNDDELAITVRDDGCGLEPDWDKGTKRKTGGYGIRNVRERLDAYFGYPYGITMQMGESGGTEVRIRLPKQTQKDGG